MSYETIIIADTPISYWPLDETGGTTYADIVGPNNGSQNGSVSPDAGLPFPASPGGSQDLTGGHIDLPTTTGFPLGGSAYTIEVWGKVVGGGKDSAGLFGYGNYGNGNQVNAFRTINGGTTDLLNYWWGNDLVVSTPGYDGDWHHFVATFDGTTRTIYLDAVSYGSDTPGTPNFQPGNATIGVTNGGENFVGNLAHVAIYDYALSTGQISAHFAAASASTGNLGSPSLGASSSATALIIIPVALTVTASATAVAHSSLLDLSSVTLLVRHTPLHAESGASVLPLAQVEAVAASGTAGSTAALLAQLGSVCAAHATVSVLIILGKAVQPAPARQVGAATAALMLPLAAAGGALQTGAGSATVLWSPPLQPFRMTSASRLAAVAITTPRTCVIFGQLIDAGGNPLAGAQVTVSLNTYGATVTYTPDLGINVVATDKTFSTDANGNWAVALIAPQDLTDAGTGDTAVVTYTFVIDQTYSITTSVFAHSPTSRSLTSVCNATPATSSSPAPQTVSLSGYIYDLSGQPLGGQSVRASLDETATDALTGIVVNATDSFQATTDQNGYYALQLVPTTSSRLGTARTYFVDEGAGGLVKNVAVPAIGGTLNLLIDSPTAALAGVDDAAVGADQTEAATLDTLTAASTLVNTGNRLRYGLTAVTGVDWPTLVSSPPILVRANPVAPQTLSFSLSKSLTTSTTTVRAVRNTTNATPTIQAAAGTGAHIISSNHGKHAGRIAWQSGSAGWGSGVQVNVTLPGAGLTSVTTGSLVWSPADAFTAQAMRSRGIVCGFLNTNTWSIFFQSADTAASSYSLYYLIEGN